MGKNALVRAMTKGGITATSTFPQINDVILVNELDALADYLGDLQIEEEGHYYEVIYLNIMDYYFTLTSCRTLILSFSARLRCQL